VATGTTKKRIEELYSLAEKDSRGFLKFLYDRGACDCVVSQKELRTDLLKQFKVRKANPRDDGIARSQNQSSEGAKKLIDEIATNVVLAWDEVIKGTRRLSTSSIVEVIPSKGNRRGVTAKFVILEGKSAKSGAKNKGLSDNFKIFKETNADIFGEEINKSKYSVLFEGYKRNKTTKFDQEGDLAQIVDVGHVKALDSSGRASAAAGIIEGILDLGGGGTKQAQLQVLSDRFLKLGLSEENKTVFSSKGGNLKFIKKQSYRIETSQKNKGDNKKSDSADTLSSKEVDKVFGDLFETIAPTAAQFIEETGSSSFKETLGDMIVNTTLKKKMYKSGKAKNLTKYLKKPTTKAGVKKVSTEKQYKATSGIATTGLTAEMAKKAPKGKSQGSEKGDGVSPESYANKIAASLKVKNAINKRLPAEIKRNMGRPALNNRTGRFRTSALIEDITPAAKTLMVKYTYRLNPYETFENTGNKKWPSGYNPKPLISKSIRNLALAMFKITNLTTRRV
tara:strand:- start:945 stop:2465 length:1521 start_codon:yes stop_codon:yes gene_type:complete